ncbi:MAG: AAA family ATPase [Phycisphaerae bacterium]
MIREIAMRNILSFGPDETRLELRGLNVLIGPNGCGKSNVLEVLHLISRLPSTNVNTSLPIVDWIWKGGPAEAHASVEVVADRREAASTLCLRHRIEFCESARRFTFVDEQLQDSQIARPGANEPRFYFRSEGGKAFFAQAGSPDAPPIWGEDIDGTRSILAQRSDPTFYPEITRMQETYEGIRTYREINCGPNSSIRRPQRTDLPTRFLLEDGSNLALVLSRLKKDVSVRRRLESLLSKFYEPATAVDVDIEGNTAQIYIAESSFTVPATRLSDGTMRWLVLLAILLDPNPPALVCLEEPEVGLHPDCVTVLADLLVEASDRIQLVVTTHSEVLVDAMSDRPENVVVCEKHDGRTTFQRLDKVALAIWLEKYSLGQLYGSGQLGGRRW